MDIKDSNIKSQTGGLKLMTVFIAVLALHVLVIGGFTVYHLMSGGSTDADLTTTDKNSKGLNGTVISDGSLPSANPGDKSATVPTPPTEVATIPATTTPPPTTDSTASTSATGASGDASSSTAAATPTATPTAATSSAPASTPTPAPAPAPTVATPTATPPPAPATEVADQGPQTPTGPISADLAPPAEPAPASEASSAPAPGPLIALTPGPVHMPPADAAPDVREIYRVKITDSYKKIAHRYHISVAELKEANHIHDNVLHTGQKLIIPSDKKMVAENVPTSTLDATPTAPVANESAAPMTTGLTSSSTVDTAGIHHHLYTVVKGDTLIRIAHRFKTTASAIMAENGITDPTKLAIGKKLRIPSSEESRSARNNPPASTQPGQVQAKGNAPTAQLANYAN